jgi:ABC-type transport system involved in cytochrome c biogenesis permease component
MSTHINNAAALVIRNRTTIKTAVIFGLAIATVIGMALGVDGTALAGGSGGGTY